METKEEKELFSKRCVYFAKGFTFSEDGSKIETPIPQEIANNISSKDFWFWDYFYQNVVRGFNENCLDTLKQINIIQENKRCVVECLRGRSSFTNEEMWDHTEFPYFKEPNQEHKELGALVSALEFAFKKYYGE